MASSMTESWVRPAAVAGTFFPADASELRRQVRALLSPESGHPRRAADRGLKALIAPHAGYVYSGPIAATAYAQLTPVRDSIKRVVLIGPAHRVRFEGIAASTAHAFETPLGSVRVDLDSIRTIAELPQVHLLDEAHAQEHCLEVHLPFLIETLGHREFTIVPLLAGQVEPRVVAQVLEALWGGPETLIVVSSDLSHYLSYEAARRSDRATSEAIESLRGEALTVKHACGCIPIQGLIAQAHEHDLRTRVLDLRNSGDTAGPRTRVVGYGAYVFAREPGDPVPAADPDAAEPVMNPADRRALVQVARRSIDHAIAHGTALPVDPEQFPPALRATRATFVTLKLADKLRGCIGTLEAARPLVADVALHACAAAIRDPRFKPVAIYEAPLLQIHISILTPPVPLQFRNQQDLIGQLRPDVDGVILQEPAGPGRRRGTFLPAVWETIPQPERFVRQLKLKAGLSADYWSDTLKAWRYEAQRVE